MCDHPTIRNLMATGEPDGREIRPYICPICGSYDIGELYLNRDREVVGCENCISTVDIFDSNWLEFATM